MAVLHLAKPPDTTAPRTLIPPGGPMSRGRQVAFGLAAIVTGALATIGLGAVFQEYEAQMAAARRTPAKVYVAVAARDLYPGLPISDQDLYAVQMLPEYLPDGVFLDPEYVVGRIPRERVLANELVRNERLADSSADQGLNVMVPRGLRALSVEITDGAALTGFLNPGNLVDVLVTATDPATSREQTTTLLQAVYVLGVDSRMGDETAEQAAARRGTHRPTVTLLVDPADAERVTHGSVVGELRLTLRTGGDAEVVVAPRAAPAPPRQQARGEAPPPELPACKEVWIWHAAERTILLVDDRGRPADLGGCAPAR